MSVTIKSYCPCQAITLTTEDDTTGEITTKCYLLHGDTALVTEMDGETAAPQEIQEAIDNMSLKNINDACAISKEGRRWMLYWGYKLGVIK